MSDYLHPRDWFKVRRGDLVEVHARTGHYGIYQIRKVARTSNYPYRVMDNGKPILLEKDEIIPVGKIAKCRHRSKP